MPKYIASRTLSGDLDWNSQVIEGDAVDGIRRLKDEIAGDLFLSGCGELACGLLDGGVVDELNLWIRLSCGRWRRDAAVRRDDAEPGTARRDRV